MIKDENLKQAIDYSTMATENTPQTPVSDVVKDVSFEQPTPTTQETTPNTSSVNFDDFDINLDI